MQAGRYRLPIEIQEPVAGARSDIGEQTDQWNTVERGWAEIIPVSHLVGNEGVIMQQVNARVTHKIKMRFREFVTPRHRIRYGERVFGILIAIDPDGLRARLEIVAAEAV